MQCGPGPQCGDFSRSSSSGSPGSDKVGHLRLRLSPRNSKSAQSRSQFPLIRLTAAWRSCVQFHRSTADASLLAPCQPTFRQFPGISGPDGPFSTGSRPRTGSSRRDVPAPGHDRIGGVERKTLALILHHRPTRRAQDSPTPRSYRTQPSSRTSRSRSPSRSSRLVINRSRPACSHVRLAPLCSLDAANPLPLLHSVPLAHLCTTTRPQQRPRTAPHAPPARLSPYCTPRHAPFPERKSLSL